MTVRMMTVALAIIASCGAGVVGTDEATKAEVGKAAPTFMLKDVDGKEHKLSDYAGKVVVLEWSNHQCPFCRRHADRRTAAKILAKFEGKPVVWLGIDSTKTCEENLDGIKKWMGKSEIGYPILLDAAGKVGKRYGAKTTPHVFVIDPRGVLVYSGAMDDDPFGDGENVQNYVEQAVSAVLKGSAVPTSTTKPYGCSVKYRS